MTIMLIPTTQHKQENIMRHPMPMRNMILPLLTSALMILAGDHMVFFMINVVTVIGLVFTFRPFFVRSTINH